VLAATFVLFPLLGLAAQLIPASVLPRQLALGVLFLCCLPSTMQASVAFTSMARGNVPAAICAASLSNLAGIALTPLLVGVLVSAHGGISGRAVVNVALQLLAPFVLGQAAAAVDRGLGDSAAPPGLRGGPGSILLVVYTAFSSAVVAGIWHQLAPVSLGCSCWRRGAARRGAHGDLTGAPVVGFAQPDRMTILFCGSKRAWPAGCPWPRSCSRHGIGLAGLPSCCFTRAADGLRVCGPYGAGREAAAVEAATARRTDAGAR